MIEQYLEIKNAYKDFIVFFRLGDFYELFFEDAKIGSKELELALTGKDAGQEERVPMCGVPFHAADTYIEKMVSKGYKVAIVEQIEDPKEAVGIVKRGVVKIVTPGTIDSGLDEKSNNYIASIHQNRRNYYLAYGDISTGDNYLTVFKIMNLTKLNILIFLILLISLKKMKNTAEQILLLLYFPQFKSKNSSRFETFFQTIQNNDLLMDEDDLQTSKIIYPDKIIRNEDKRTSLIIKGIPTDLTKKEIRNIIEKYGNINYLYVTKNINKREQISSIAYINVINYRTIIPLFMNLRNASFLRDGKLYKLKIMYSAAQGKKQLKQYIKRIYLYEYLE